MGNKSVCLHCRVSYNNGIDYYRDEDIYARICPLCRREMKDLTYRFKPPKKGDSPKWETIRFLLAHGFYFQHIYDDENQQRAEYPENLKDAKVFAEKYYEQRILIFRIFDTLEKLPGIIDVEQENKIIADIQRIPFDQILNEQEKYIGILNRILCFQFVKKSNLQVTKRNNEFNKRLVKIRDCFGKNEKLRDVIDNILNR